MKIYPDRYQIRAKNVCNYGKISYILKTRYNMTSVQSLQWVKGKTAMMLHSIDHLPSQFNELCELEIKEEYDGYTLAAIERIKAEEFKEIEETNRLESWRTSLSDYDKHMLEAYIARFICRPSGGT